MTMTWQNGRQLATLQQGNNNISYSYDSDSVRISKNVNGTEYTYAYLNGMLMYETRGEAKFYYSYDSNGMLYSVKYTLTDSSDLMTYYYTHNSRGDIVGLYNGNGDLKAHYEYDAWGKVLSVTDANGNAVTSETHIGTMNPFRYRGYYLDAETGLYYLMSRYYDPVTHRFINADGYFQSGGNILDANMSAYCRNNPINFTDSTGKFATAIAESLFKIFVSAVIAASVALTVTSIAKHESVQQKIADSFSSIANSFSNIKGNNYSKSQDSVSAKNIPIAPTAPHDPTYNYWTAEITNGIVTPIIPLTYSEARVWVSGENNLLCRDHASAIAIVKFYPSAIWDAAHGDKEQGYLNHYHLSSEHNNHIWYYGE